MDDLVIMVLMQKVSLVHAKAHLSRLVDEALHHRRRTLIMRHGKPVVAIVPLDERGMPERATEEPGRSFSPAEIAEMFSALGSASPELSAVDDLLSSRR